MNQDMRIVVFLSRSFRSLNLFIITDFRQKPGSPTGKWRPIFGRAFLPSPRIDPANACDGILADTDVQLHLSFNELAFSSTYLIRAVELEWNMLG
jgi:hypothetical protein